MLYTSDYYVYNCFKKPTITANPLRNTGYTMLNIGGKEIFLQRKKKISYFESLKCKYSDQILCIASVYK